MHGVVFSSFRDYVTATFGRDVTQQVFAGGGSYLLSEAYPDEDFLGFVTRAVEVTGSDPDQLVYDFGVFTAQTTFARLYPAFFQIAKGTRPFLLTVEKRIHELVRATIPNAEPPQLRVAPLGTDGVTIAYTSPRRLCVLLEGLVEGAASHYDEAATIDQSECMLRGDPACLFEVRLAGLRAPPEHPFVADATGDAVGVEPLEQ